MKIIKLDKDLPDPISYLDAVKKYQDWDNIQQFAEYDVELQHPFITRTDSTHPYYCPNCEKETNPECPIHQEEIAIRDSKYETHAGKVPTMKRCPAIIDTLNSGAVLCAWDDFYFEATEIQNHLLNKTIFAYTDGFKPAHFYHTTPQVDFIEMGFDVSHNMSVKLFMPYRLETSNDNLILYKDLFWLGSMPFKVVEGLQDMNAFSGMFINTIWNIEDGTKVIIKKGTPIVHLLEVPKSTLEPFEIVNPEDLDKEYYQSIIDQEKVVLGKNGYRNKQRKMLE